MKPWGKILSAVVYFLIIKADLVHAQCSNALQNSITYDTLMPGTGNSTHSITLPQFDPSIGTLMSVNINSKVSVNYGFTLKNQDTAARNFSVAVGRYDYFSSPALSSAYSNLTSVPIGTYPLNPGDGVSVAPYTILYRYGMNDSLSANMVPFLGTGSVAFSYKPITYTNLTGGSVYYYSATASDTVHFSITYYYCNSAILKNTLNAFNAWYDDRGLVNITWSASGWQDGILYQVEKSDDQTHFAAIAERHGANNSGVYSYDYPSNTEGKWYFRLKIITADGAVSYSEIKMVEIGDKDQSRGVRLYPNPARDHIQVTLPLGDWDILLFSSNGGLVQKESFYHTALAQLSFMNRLSAGVYFVRALNRKTASQLTLSFIAE